MIEYLKEENKVLREQLGGKRLRFTDAQRRRLARRGKLVGRRGLQELGCIVTPDTILRWYKQLVAKKYDGSQRRGLGRPRTASDVRSLVVVNAHLKSCQKRSFRIDPPLSLMSVFAH